MRHKTGCGITSGCGSSTIIDALSLALGRTKMVRPLTEHDFTSRLLEAEDVVRWISARFPVVLIDEFHDCLPVRLAIAQRLHGHVGLFVAADDFQNLNMTTESPAVVWLRSAGTVEDL